MLFYKTKGTFAIASIFISFYLNAQTVSDSSRKLIVYSKNHVSFGVASLVVTKAELSGEKKYNLNTSPQLGFDFGFNYHYNVNRYYSIIAGLHTGILGRNLEYAIPKTEFDPPTEGDITSNGAAAKELDVGYLKMPIELEKRWFSTKEIWNAKIGMSILYSLLTGGETTHRILYPNGQQIQYLEEETTYNNNNRPWLNYHISGGHIWLLNNNNLIEGNLIANFSSTEFVKGSYKFTIPGKPTSEGKYGVTGSFIGVSVKYIFTGANNKIRRLYSKGRN